MVITRQGLLVHIAISSSTLRRWYYQSVNHAGSRVAQKVHGSLVMLLQRGLACHRH